MPNVPATSGDRDVARMAALADRILAPLAGRSDADWLRAPPEQWSAGQIVHHLALAMDLSGMGIASRLEKPAMERRPLTLSERIQKLVVLGLGWFPLRRTAPRATRPPEQPGREATERLLREAGNRFVALAPQILPLREHNLFLKHPRFGDLTYREWLRFHDVHAQHHLKQIRRRLS